MMISLLNRVQRLEQNATIAKRAPHDSTSTEALLAPLGLDGRRALLAIMRQTGRTTFTEAEMTVWIETLTECERYRAMTPPPTLDACVFVMPTSPRPGMAPDHLPNEGKDYK